MTEPQPETKKCRKVIAVALERDAYELAVSRAKANGVTRKVWVSNAIRIAAALSASCCTEPRKETRNA